jgi:uncharacterized protein YhdP
MHFYSNHVDGTTLGNATAGARVEIADLREPVLTIDADATGTLETIRQLSIQSPIAKVFGGQLDRIQVDGEASFDLQLRYPLGDKLNYAFTVGVRTNNGRLSIDGFTPPLTELSGLVTVTRDIIQSESLTARFLGEPVRIDLARATDDMPKYSIIASATGIATGEGLIGELGLPLAGRLRGSTPYSAGILFPRGEAEEPVPLHIAVETNLEGLAIEMPVPVGKAPGETRPLSLHIEFPGSDRINSFGSSPEDFEWSVSFLKEQEQWDFDRGVIAVGGAEATEPETRGLHIVGETPEVRLKEWLNMRSEGSDRPGLGERIRSIDLTVDDLYAVGQHFSRHRVRLDRGAEEWLIELDGEEAVGSLVVPYDFSGDKPLVVDMAKLILPGKDEVERDDTDLTDPRTLPPLSIKADDFALGLRHFGNLEAEFVRIGTGLEAVSITSRDDSFEFRDIKQTTARLNYQPGIVGQDMEVEIDVSWPGGPREDILAHLDGNIGIRLGTGQLDEVEPGAGRVFGLLSVVALPRRLSLDFRDVLGKGFGFDEITGNFRVVSGETFTCNLSLKSPAADIGIVGRAGLGSRDYEQSAMVSASVGNTLPIVGAVVAGPGVAAALLVFSQIFKKPLQDMGQVYYSIGGSWDEPAMEVTDAEQFTKTYEAAGCLRQAE